MTQQGTVRELVLYLFHMVSSSPWHLPLCHSDHLRAHVSWAARHWGTVIGKPGKAPLSRTLQSSWRWIAELMLQTSSNKIGTKSWFPSFSGAARSIWGLLKTDCWPCLRSSDSGGLRGAQELAFLIRDYTDNSRFKEEKDLKPTHGDFEGRGHSWGIQVTSRSEEWSSGDSQPGNGTSVLQSQDCATPNSLNRIKGTGSLTQCPQKGTQPCWHLDLNPREAQVRLLMMEL